MWLKTKDKNCNIVDRRYNFSVPSKSVGLPIALKGYSTLTELWNISTNTAGVVSVITADKMHYHVCIRKFWQLELRSCSETFDKNRYPDCFHKHCVNLIFFWQKTHLLSAQHSDASFTVQDLIPHIQTCWLFIWNFCQTHEENVAIITCQIFVNAPQVLNEPC